MLVMSLGARVWAEVIVEWSSSVLPKYALNQSWLSISYRASHVGAVMSSIFIYWDVNVRIFIKIIIYHQETSGLQILHPAAHYNFHDNLYISVGLHVYLLS